MSNATQDSFTDTDIQKIINGIEKGLTIAEATSMENTTLEGLYTLAYNFYTNRDFEKAETIFQALCIYKHNEERFWLGLGSSRQGLQKYQGAVDAYSMAGLSSNLKNPIPFFYAAQCFLKLEDKESAISVLQSVLTIGDRSNYQHVIFMDKAQEILNLLAK